MKKTIFIMILLISVQFIIATTYYVPLNYSTIQGAINASSSGDEIVVFDGTYYEDITINTSFLTIRSYFGPEDCIIDGNTHCITMGTATTLIEGFTFTDASSTALIISFATLSELSNCIFEDNEGSPSAIYSERGSIEEISDCIFRNNDGSYAIQLMRDYGLGQNPTVNETFSNNIFLNNENSGSGFSDGVDFFLENSSNNYSGTYESNTFKGSEGGIFIWANGETEILNCVFDEALLDDNVIYQGDITINYSCFSGSPSAGYNWEDGNLTNTDPELNSTTCQPLWNSSVKSPCIDVGDPSLSDDNDGTPPDIGAVSAINHRIDEIELPDPSTHNGWKWLSFPALDNILDDADVAENVLEDVLDVAILDTLFSEDYEIYWYLSNWQHDYEQFSRTEGFKFLMLDDITFEVPGFKEDDNTTISLTGSSNENWIGYWLEDTQDVDDAFEDYWDGSNIYYIQHQRWTAHYYEEEWHLSTRVPELSYGDMVVVKCRTTISDFEWNQGTPVEKTVYADPEYFSFEEQADYVPLYIEVGDDDVPEEIGAFVNGVCIGATVVEDIVNQINVYTTSAPPGNIELELYYGNRSENKIISSYKCVTSSNPNTVLEQLSSGDCADSWFVDLREDSSMVPTPAKLSLSNYPNPFNPSTSIAYSLPNDGMIEIEIYNIKGQLVKTLVNEEQLAGLYQTDWNGKDNNEKNVSTGIYFYKLSTGEQTLIKKMLLLE